MTMEVMRIQVQLRNRNFEIYSLFSMKLLSVKFPLPTRDAKILGLKPNPMIQKRDIF